MGTPETTQSISRGLRVADNSCGLVAHSDVRGAARLTPRLTDLRLNYCSAISRCPFTPIVLPVIAGPSHWPWPWGDHSGTVGAKPILTEHLPLGATAPSSLVEAENSFVPDTVAQSKVAAVPVFFFAV